MLPSLLQLFLLAITFLLSWIWLKNRERKSLRMPPGPITFPIIGNLLQLAPRPQDKMMEWRKKFGDIISLDFGSYKAVALNNPTIIRKCLAEQSFSGRPKFEIIYERSQGDPKGLVLVDSKAQIEQRRFVLKNLRDFQFGKKDMELCIREDMEELVEILNTKVDEPITIRPLLLAAQVNSLWKICTGLKLGQQDPKLLELLRALSQSLEDIGVTGMCFFFPKISRMFPKLSGWHGFVDAQVPIVKIIEKMTKEISLSFQSDQKRHLVDAYLQQIQNTTDKESSFYGEEGIKQMNMTLLDLLGAGTDTTSTTLLWAFLILALHKDIQDKIQEEVDRVIGSSKLPELNDKPNMPYTECFIMEVLRYSSLVPLSVFHRTTEDVIVEDFTIPKDTIVSPNLHGVMHDPEYWKDPSVIRPERFLKNDGTVDRNKEAWMPFSVGKRMCIGEKLAMMNLFLFLTLICQHFEIKFDPTEPRPTLKHMNGIMQNPVPHKLILHKRL